MRQGEGFSGDRKDDRLVGLLLAGGGFLLLLFLLTYPAGPDQTIYLTIGRALSKGHLFYSEITDTKPPFIHLLFALSQMIFGDGILGFRIVEFLAQSATLTLILYGMRRVGFDWFGSGLAAFLYALLYISLGPDGTAQPEGFVGLFLLPMMLLQTFRRTRGGMLLVGILAGILFTAKFTFLAVLGGSVLAEFLVFRGEDGWFRRGFQHSIFIVLGALLVIGLFLGGLFGFGLVHEWQNMSTWSSGRLGQIMASTNIIEAMLTQTGSYLAHGLSLTITILLTLAIARTANDPPQPTAHNSQLTAQFPRLALLMLLFLLLSTLVEMMFIHYQYSRMTLPIVVLVGPLLASQLRSLFPLPRRPYQRALVILLLLLGLLFSPLPRTVEKLRSGIAWRFSSDNSVAGSYDTSSDRRLGEIGTIAERIAEESEGDPSVFALSEVAGFLYSALGTTPGFRTVYYYHLLSPWTPEKWEEEFTGFLESAPPEFLVIELYAHDHTFSGGPEPTLDSLYTFKGIRPILEKEYREELRTQSFLLLRRQADGDGS